MFWQLLAPKKCYHFQRYESLVFVFPPVSDILPDICGRLRGESIVRASLRGAYCGFCKRAPVSTVPRSPWSRRGLQRIITQKSRKGWGRLIGCLRGTYYRFCKPAPVFTVPRSSRNRRGLQPIITQEPWMGWECLVDCLPMNSSVDFGLCVCTGRTAPDSPVRCDVIAYLTSSANVDIAPGPLATNVWATGVQRGVQNTYPYAQQRLTPPNI